LGIIKSAQEQYVIRVSESAEDIMRCFPLMKELRTHLVESEFISQIQRQQRGGYRLAYLESNGQIVALAGFRVLDKLDVGRSLYVDDLVTVEAARSKGHGKTLLAWLIQQAKGEHCSAFELDCGVQRFAAHRFYQTNRMVISAHHFALKL
jgi:GNAT superfamily N-acetyltransferase